MTITEVKTKIIKKVTKRAEVYLNTYILYKENADKKELEEMLGEEGIKYDSFYSVKIKTENKINKRDMTEAVLPKMTVDCNAAKKLISFLSENDVTADTVYEMIDDINSLNDL